MIASEKLPQSPLNTMQLRPFGKTGIEVSPLGFGAAEIGFENVADEAVSALLSLALESGLNVIDTAECYVDSEEKIGRALRGKRKDCLIFTKCGHSYAGRLPGLFTRAYRKLSGPLERALGRSLADWDPRLLERSIDRSLRRLKTDWIDLIQLHSCSEEILRQGAVIEVLRRARQAGKARHIGYSGDGAAALYAVQSEQFDTLQTSLNIADQQAIDVTLPLAARLGMGVIAKRPLANAVWKNTHRPDNSYHHVYWDRLQELRYDFLRAEHDAVEIALRFTLSVPAVHTAIVGTTKPGHWRKNAEITAAGPLLPEQFETIRSRWKMAARPDWVGQE
jgi:aryl-alcohol dehydrogenase-like predicted oxidoreductase